MSETYEPGTVAVATVRGVEGVRVMRTTSTRSCEDFWLSFTHVGGWRSHTLKDVTDIQPLVVLDLADYDVRPLLPDIRESATEYDTRLGPGVALDLLDTIADQIEAQTKPARIPEPVGVGAVVKARIADCVGGPSTLVRGNYPMRPWHAGDLRLNWDELIDPVLIRDGLS